jgi:L-ascorbate metabolism protein UlaG (beta-lactamase superfamily)
MACSSAGTSQPAVNQNAVVPVKLTWISIANWLVEIGKTRILIDAYYTRSGQPAASAQSSPLFTQQGTLGLDYTTQPIPSDRTAVEGVLNGLDYKTKKIGYVITGHSNFDHDPDAPLVAQLTGAKIIGPPSTCYQAEAEGIPASQCKPVTGGETFDLGNGATLAVVHINHSGNNTNIDLHQPAELTRAPKIDPTSTAGGLRWGILEDMPNGGGGRMFLIKVKEPGGKTLSLTYQDTGSAYDFDQPINVLNCTGPDPAPCATTSAGPTYPSPADNVTAAMKQAGLASVDLWIEGADPALAGLEIPILNPKWYLPTHWDGLWSPFLKGMPMPFKAPGGWDALLAAHAVQQLAPGQYMDTWLLDESGLKAVSNHSVKQKLGLSDVQQF